MKFYRLVWTTSLLVISGIIIVSTVCNLAGVKMPDILTRFLGILDLCAVVALVFTSVKLKIWKKEK